MKPHILIGVSMGCVLLVVGRVPGLLCGLMDGIENLRDTIVYGSPMGRQRRAMPESIEPSYWLTALGAMLIAVSLYAYLAG